MSIISQTDQNIMALLAENKKLKEEIVDLKKNEKAYENKLFCLQQSQKNHQEENKKLKEELELSRSFNERFREGHELCEVYKGRCSGIEAENEKLNKFYEKITEAIGEHYFGGDGILPKIKELVKAYDFMSICSDWATGVFHLLGEMADEETANKIIATEYMEREEFQCFNPNWSDHHG